MPNRYGFSPQSVAVVLGTRPEIIKLAQIIALLGDAAHVIHTGQHYDRHLSDDLFADLHLAPPEVFLGTGGERRGSQIGQGIQLLDEHFALTNPLAVIVQGDTNSVVSGAIAANARNIFLCHVEAGLRSHDRTMPEEHNRVIADHLSDLCCAPTYVALENLAVEGIDSDRVVMTGNTIVETVRNLIPTPDSRQAVVGSYGLEPGAFALATFHRPENVDHPETLRTILTELASLPVPVLFPIHPRTRASMERYGLSTLLDPASLVEPIGYRDFLALQAECAVMISDSGGIAEEASILKRPLVVVRRSTERPEVMGTFAVRVSVGTDIGLNALRFLEVGWHHLQTLPTPYGDGTASEQTLQALAERLS